MGTKTAGQVVRWTFGLLMASLFFSSEPWSPNPGLQPPAIEAADNPPPGGGKLLPRMYDGAPPQIPHSIAGLQGLCLGCHLEGVQGATLVPHPDRPNCLQCHIPQDPSAKPFVRNTFGDPSPGRRR